MTSVLPPFVQVVSGSLEAASANASTYPLDVIKLQSLRKLLTAHRLPSLYDGPLADTGATLL
jgi:adenine nucleotide transporter 17